MNEPHGDGAAGVPDALGDADPAGPGRRLTGATATGLDRASAGPGPVPALRPSRDQEPGAPAPPGPLRLDQLPLLMLTGPLVAGVRSPRVVEHVAAGSGRRAETLSGVVLPFSESGLDRAAGLVALGADHARGCLGSRGISLGDATRYAARLERLGLRAETSWQRLAEGYYVLDAEPGNLARLVDEAAIVPAERLLVGLPGWCEDSPVPAASLVLLGPTCTTRDR